MYKTESYTQTQPIALHTPEQVFQAAKNGQWKAVLFALVKTRFKPAVMRANTISDENMTLLDFAYKNATSEIILELKIQFDAKTFAQIQEKQCKQADHVIDEIIDGFNFTDFTNDSDADYTEDSSGEYDADSDISEADNELLQERLATLQLSSSPLYMTQLDDEAEEPDILASPSFTPKYRRDPINQYQKQNTESPMDVEERKPLMSHRTV